MSPKLDSAFFVIYNKTQYKEKFIMNIFEGIVQTNQNGDLIYNQWIEWKHFLVPNKPDFKRELFRNLLLVFNHCRPCTALSGCYFVTNNMPNYPLHENCDCELNDLTFIKVSNLAYAKCDIRKFTNYVFSDDNKSNGKKHIFNALGFDIEDSEYLQKEICKQALAQYLQGNYILKNLDGEGQRLAIPTTLNGSTFYSGWLLCPEGLIKNTTPFGGWIK